jgi:hypothetical protein
MTALEGRTIMAVSDEHLRRPARLGPFAGGLADDEAAGGGQASFVVERDEDGFWCAHVQLRSAVAAVGDGVTREAAIDDLRASLALLLDVIEPHS